MSINNKRSYTEYTVTQPTTDFAIGFDDFDEGSKDNILVTLNGVLVESLGYAAIRKNESTVSITPAITEGTVRLTRETDIDEPFHKFTAGALFSAKSMDENFQQVRHSQQEVRDGFAFLEYNTNGIVQASKEATAQAKAATVEATASAVRAETAADTAVQAVDSLQGVVIAATTATTQANAATATATTAASQATAATTSAQNAAQAANTAKQEAAAAAANANAATVDTLAATGRANEAADVVADLVVGKVRAQDVSTVDGSTQAVKNTEFRNELDALPFVDGVLADTFVTMTPKGAGGVTRNLLDVSADTINAKDFGAIGDGVYRKAFPDFSSADDIVLEYPEFAKYLVGTPEQIPYKKIDLLNASQDWFAIQKAVDHIKTLGGGVLELRGTFVLTHPVFINFSHITVDGGGTSKIINRFGQAVIDAGVPRLYRSTSDAMFSIAGRLVAAGNITENILEHSNKLKIDDPLLYSVGDKVSMLGDRLRYTRNLSIITNIDVGTKTITLDRPITNEVAASTVDRVSPLTKVIPVGNVHITGFDVDFNGTEAEPRYGYFVLGSAMYASSVTNITGKNIASKVVEFSRCFDCDIDNVKVIRGVDNLDTGGHGYAVRLAMCNDVHVNRVKATYCRHTVDLSGSSRNTISNCSSYFATSASYLGHMNGCKNNIFTNNIAAWGTVAAYSFKTDSGDTGNIVDGGYVVNETVIYMEQDNSNVIKNLVIINGGGGYILESAGEASLDGCTIISNSPLLSGFLKGKLRFNNCDFRLTGYRSLGNILNNNGKILEFNNCVFDIDSPNTVLETRVSDVDITLNKCVVSVKNTISNFPVFGGQDYNLIRAIDCTLEFIPTPSTDSEGVTTYTDGTSMFSLGNANSTLELIGNTIINSRYVFRRYGTSPKMILGSNTLINSAYSNMANTLVESRGAVTIDSASPSGTWSEGSTIQHSKPIMGYMGAVKTAAAWVRVNQLVMAGDTANRPGSVANGFMYFDTTLNKPIYKVAEGWVDAVGVTA